MNEAAQRSDAFEDMPQYPITREEFRDVFERIDAYAWGSAAGLPYEGPGFKFWEYDGDVYILHKPSGILVNWYKIGHTGRANTCNGTLTLEEYRQFADMLEDELKECGDKDYDWNGEVG